MTLDLFEHRCPECPPEDNCWPDECWNRERGMCTACAHEKPKRVRRPCSSCDRKVETLDRVKHPRCRACKRRLANLSIPHRRSERRKKDRRRYQVQKRAAA